MVGIHKPKGTASISVKMGSRNQQKDKKLRITLTFYWSINSMDENDEKILTRFWNR